MGVASFRAPRAGRGGRRLPSTNLRMVPRAALGTGVPPAAAKQTERCVFACRPLVCFGRLARRDGSEGLPGRVLFRSFVQLVEDEKPARPWRGRAGRRRGADHDTRTERLPAGHNTRLRSRADLKRLPHAWSARPALGKTSCNNLLGWCGRWADAIDVNAALSRRLQIEY